MKTRRFVLFAALVSVVFLTLLGVRLVTAQGGGTTELVSVASNGTQGNQSSFWPSISADGRYVAFASNANNLCGYLSILVHDRQTNQTTCIASGSYENPAISADGRYVTYHLCCYEIFVYDRQMQQTTQISVAPDGSPANDWSRRPAISGDGRFVAFESWASNLVSGDTNNFCDNNSDGQYNENCQDIFVHDRQTGQITLVSVSSSGVQGNNKSEGTPAISTDGRYVAFKSYASNLVPNDTNNQPDVFVRDRQTGQTTRVSVDINGAQINNWSSTPAFSADGHYVAFLSLSGTAGRNVFVHNQQTGQTIRIAQSSGGGLGNSWRPQISLSADGHYVVYEMMDGQVYLYNQQTGQTTLISIAPDSTKGNGYSEKPSISADGRFVAFSSEATNLVNGDTNGYEDVFVRDRGPEPESSYSISGQILAYEDTLINGNLTQISHPLGYTVVTLINHTKGTSVTTVSTTTGRYNTTINANIGDSMSVRTSLIYHRSNTDFLQVQDASAPTAPIVYIETQPFPATSATSIQQDLHFVGTLPYIIPAGMSRYHLADTALMYYHFQQALDYTIETLNVNLDYRLPIEVYAYDESANEARALYQPSDSSIHLSVSESASQTPNRPMNREWHEFFHHLMQDTIEIPPRAEGDKNHDGFINSNTSDSWTEGWAEFWSMALADHLGQNNPSLYVNLDLEVDWQPWSYLTQDQKGNWNSLEELAVAGLLWDLYDGAEQNNRDDAVSLRTTDLWRILTEDSPRNVNELYNSLSTTSLIYKGDLDQIYVSHGFFGDRGWLIQDRKPSARGNEVYELENGEVIGFGGREGRFSISYIDGAYLLVNLQNEQGQSVDNGTLLITVEFEPPDNIYNYSYQYPLFTGNGNMVYILAPWTNYTATVKVQALNSSTPPYSISNIDFWNMIPNSGKDYVAEKIFVISHWVYLPLILK